MSIQTYITPNFVFVLTKFGEPGSTNRHPWQSPMFPRACWSMQSQGQQFRINEILSFLDSISSTHLPIGSHEWEVVVASQHNKNFPDKEQTADRTLFTLPKVYTAAQS